MFAIIFLSELLSAYRTLFLGIDSIIGSLGWSLILLSFIISVILSPLVKLAGRMVKRENEIASVILPQIKQIKLECSGEQQHRRIQNLYRRYSYSPFMALRKVAPLFVQLPALFITYYMLKDLEELKGASFFILKDLSLEDNLINGVNLLPILMTLFNLIAAFATPHFTKRDLTQVSIIAFIFLVLLYTQSSGLLLYWTANNAILMFKNVYSWFQTNKKKTGHLGFGRLLCNVADLVFGLIRTTVTPSNVLKCAFIPLVALTAYCALYYKFVNWLIEPDYAKNVNAHFAYKTCIYSSLLAAASCLIFIILYLHCTDKDNRPKIIVSPEKIYTGDAFLLLLPLTPIVRYLINNQDILSLNGFLYVVTVFTTFSAVLLFVFPLVLGFISSTRLLLIVGLTFAFTITNMAALSFDLHWLQEGNLKVQILIFCATFFLIGTIQKFQGRKALYLCIAVFFFVNNGIQLIFNDEVQAQEEVSNDDSILVNLVDSRKPTILPNIYLLVYDAYVINETMLQYGVDNSAQEACLEKMGFKLYPYTYSIAAGSTATMSRVLNASTSYYGNQRRAVSGDGVVQNIFKSYGYETFGIFSNRYFFQGYKSSYDFTMPKKSSSVQKTILHSIFMGEFRFDFSLDKLTYEEFVECKLGVFESELKQPRFIYMHSDFPGHSQNSGACLNNEIELLKEKKDQMKLLILD